MRVYAYEDRFGDARFGVLLDGGLLTGAQLEKRGGLREIDTHISLGIHIQLTDDWAAHLRRATRRALKAGARLIDPEARRPIAVIDELGIGDKIVCVGLNYGDHAAEGGRAVPERPMLFAKFANAIVGDGEAIVRPAGTRALDLEVELGVVIGRRARRVTEAVAPAHVAGYVVVNDVSARDWQGNPQALRQGRYETAGLVPGPAQFLGQGAEFYVAECVSTVGFGDGGAAPALFADFLPQGLIVAWGGVVQQFSCGGQGGDVGQEASCLVFEGFLFVGIVEVHGLLLGASDRRFGL